ncbi:MAG: efflux RND transporter periplasmic adaptor subunit [Anaerolineales bacterium]|nr:efflux RND transporter periplasmic adaptor subunit [Anaerolineales bacterium]
MKIYWLAMTLIAFILSACGGVNSTPTALPTVVLEGGNAGTVAASHTGGGVIASGVVVPSQKADIALAVGGRVESVDVVVGEQVQAGQALVQLEGKEAAQAAVSAAQFELEQAQQALDDLKTQAESDRIQAMQEIVTFERAVRDAQYALDNFNIPSNQAGLDAVSALNKMKDVLDDAREAFEPYKFKSSGDSTRQDLKEMLDLAQSDYNAAVRRLQLEYNLEVAQAQLNQAQQDYAVLKDGQDPDKVRLAEARLVNAQNQLSAAQAELSRLSLIAPFDGVVSEVNLHSGEYGITGQAILTLADLENLRVETTDLSERDVPQVKVGQSVTVNVKALNREESGKVSQIAPLASTLGGDVVYKVTVDLDEIPEGLREGMSVEVQFE